MNAIIDISDAKIKTERLLLRPFKDTDLNDFFEYASVEGVGEMAGWIHHKSIDESKKILDLFIGERKTFAIEYNHKVIGSVGIETYNEDVLPELADKSGREIGFVLSKDYWGRGLMTEAVKEVVSYLFNELKLDFIVCAHFSRNTRSKRVQEKCGFMRYKTSEYTTEYGTVEQDLINILYR